MNITASAPATYLAGTTKSGSKIHRTRLRTVTVGKNAGKTVTESCCGVECYRNDAGWNAKGSIVSTFEVETGTIPAGALCSNCFPGVEEIAAPVAAPVAAPAPKPAAPIAAPAEMISFEEAFALIEAAGHADMVGGSAWIKAGEIDRAAVLDGIAGWNAC